MRFDSSFLSILFRECAEFPFEIDFHLFFLVRKISGQRKQVGQFLKAIQVLFVRARDNPVSVSVFPAITRTTGYFLLQVLQGFTDYKIQRKRRLLGYCIIDVPELSPQKDGVIVAFIDMFPPFLLSQVLR